MTWYHVNKYDSGRKKKIKNTEGAKFGIQTFGNEIQ